jgi:hypothetical protein
MFCWQRIISTALLLATLATTELNAQDAVALKVSCEADSLVKKETTVTELVSRFGREHVREQEVEVGEGETRRGFVLFPNHESKELIVLPKNSTEPMQIVLRGKRSQWQTAQGITLGTTLKEIERLNGRSFVLTGFGWDYAGTVVDWKGGRLQPDGNCRFQPRMGYGRRAGSSQKEDDIAAQVMGDRDYSSEHPAMQSLNPAVYEIVITFESE